MVAEYIPERDTTLGCRVGLLSGCSSISMALLLLLVIVYGSQDKDVPKTTLIVCLGFITLPALLSLCLVIRYRCCSPSQIRSSGTHDDNNNFGTFETSV